MKKLILMFLIIAAYSVVASDVNIKGFDFTNEKGSENRLSIKFEGVLNDNPQITINEKILQIVIPNSHINLKIQKKTSEGFVTASQIDRSSVGVKVLLPYSLQGKESLVNITLKDSLVDVSFPKDNYLSNKVSRSPAIVSPKQLQKIEASNADAEKLDENYLTTLVLENEKLALARHKEEVKTVVNKKEDQIEAIPAMDKVEIHQSSTIKEVPKTLFNKEEPVKSNFSLSSYVGKFVAFLSLMILCFYGILTLFKKGVIKKGKLGFLHSTKLVEVISTTHVAPKRTLMVVKAHKQVFLISNTENGIQLISEISDVTGLLKTGEEDITGSNFDTNLYKANKSEKEFKLKEDSVINSYSLDDMLNDDNEGVGVDKTETHALNSIKKTPVKDQVKFSDQIKTKIKNMKQIQ